ncbi:hypothetical protein FJR48_00990 [Sulfurimonas lithotrophica]|uniref:Uncharacterized protein n=1 Tax=Sulfurimonas lithotrophica TaxID=2590022 RepID=A0A5P8NY61_9BACT|nr:hypothetical protein [Sulfurimonas lithotrophica]QFR48375.1 hypothetical protein FJR48_00990 [Sulfurimonas lithotrophica]
MVKLAKVFGYSLFFVLALMYFTPKVALYYFAEMQLKPYGVIVTDENVVDNGFTLGVKDALVTFKEIESAKIKDVNIALFGIYNKVSLSDITLASTAASFVPTDVKTIDITYTILNPLNIVAVSSGGFGEVKAEVNLLEKKMLLKLEPSKIMSQKYTNTLRNLQKSKDGGYEYAKTF